MTYGEMKEYVLQLLNQYSVAGGEVPLTYNNQADYVARIPALTRDGLYYVTTTCRKLRAVADLAEPERVGEMLVYTLPDDYYQMMSGGLIRLDERGRFSRYHGYRMIGGRQIMIPAADKGVYKLEYFRYPGVPEGTPEADDFLDCPPEAQEALAFYVAAHLAMEDSSFLYGALYNEFEMKLTRLQEGLSTDCTGTEDVYGL